jgi:N-dimethylarginine dimethylaminohydrolase
MNNHGYERQTPDVGCRFFDDNDAINAYMDAGVPVDVQKAMAEHQAIREAFQSAGTEVIKVDPPANCQDGVYTANWGLCRGNKVVLSTLPPQRQAETPYAEQVLKSLGKEIIHPPEGLRFSGQGDALPCGNLLFAGSQYRTDPAVHAFLAEQLGYEVISLQTVPNTDEQGQPLMNGVTGWPDSFFYDIDLAIAIIREDLIAWCPEAFTPESQAKVRALPLEKIEVSLQEAREGFACNLVSTGETVIMSYQAPQLKAAIEAHGLKVITVVVSELAKGGGFIRCTSLSLSNN